jgi:Ca-activated chloride channel family protein
MRLANPQALLLLLALPALAALYRRGDARRRAALGAWGGRTAIAPKQLPRGVLLAAMVVLTLALARPVPVSPPVAAAPKTGDLVFLLDVSRSMLADDAAPTRLGRAKAIIAGILTQLKGDRVALIAFAGNTSVECPLTVDYAFFQEVLDATGPDAVTRGGSQLGDAIRFAADQGFDDLARENKQLVLLSDGEDHGGAPAEAAREAARRGVHILAIGVGDESGALVPQSETDRTPFLYQGRPVQTRLDARTLQSVGSYVDARNLDARNLDAAAVYRQYLASSGRRAGARADDQNPLWPYLVALALALLFLETRAAERRTATAIMAIVLLLFPTLIPAQTVEEWTDKGLHALWSHQSPDAVHYFSQAAEWSPQSAEVRFNLGLAFYQDEQFRVAADAFEHAGRIASDLRLKAKSKFGQGNAMYRYAQETMHRDTPAALRAAVTLWREALELDPTLTDAQFNIDLVQELLRRQSPPSGAPDTNVPRPGADERRERETDPSQIVRESKVPPPSQAKARKPVEKDW